MQGVAEFGKANGLDEVRDEAGFAGQLEVFVRAVAAEGDALHAEHDGPIAAVHGVTADRA